MNRDTGDTLVEVLIATAILSAAVITGLGIMNFGFGIILNSIERTQVQATVSSQVSLVRHARDAYIAANRTDAGSGPSHVWAQINTATPTIYNQNVCRTDAAPDTAAMYKPFYISENGEELVTGVPAAATETPSAGHGLWVEAVKTSATTDYIDIYVKACWHPPVGDTNEETKTVVRLYVP